MKIVINRKYGRLDLSHEGKMLLLSKKGIKVFPYANIGRIMTTFNEISTREKELKNAFWDNFGFDYLTPLNIKLLAIELDSVLRNSTETTCYSDKIIESGAEKGVWLSSHYFKNREGVVFSMDSSFGIRFAGWASFSNLEYELWTKPGEDDKLTKEEIDGLFTDDFLYNLGAFDLVEVEND